MSVSLAGCNTMNDTGRFANATVGTGVKYTATTVGTGVGYVAKTGAVVGNGVGMVVDKSIGLVSGRPASYHAHTQTITRGGHHYVIENGKYVRVN